MDDIFGQSAALDSLTEKQTEVLALVSEGMTSKEIARKLGISESAVNQRIEVIRQRLGGLPRTQIARLYRRMSTIVLTVPASNSVTGKSIQLQPDPADGQQSQPEGSEVSTAPSQAPSQVGSHPSTFSSFVASRVGDGWFSRLIALGVPFVILFAIAATAALIVDIVSGIDLIVHRH